MSTTAPASGSAMVQQSTITLPVAALFSVLIGLVSAVGGGAASYAVLKTDVAQSRVDIAELRKDSEAHAKALTDAKIVLANHEQRLVVVERSAETVTKIHEDLVEMKQKLDALCRANKAANCGP